VPEGRRIHSVPTPRWGGLAVYAALSLSLGLAAVVSRNLRQATSAYVSQPLVFWMGATLLLVVGLIDDRRSVKAVNKLIAEIIAATAVALAGYQMRTVFGFELGLLSVPATVLWIVAFVNAFNMIDGLDGLAAGLGVIMSATLIVFLLGATNSALGLTFTLICLCGALLGFLPYNFNRATIFLGDSGSMFVGFVLATASVASSTKGSAAVTILVPVLALGLPMAELSLTVLRRLLRSIRVVKSDAIGKYGFRLIGKPALFTADGGHIHHQLIARGLSQRAVVLLMYGICIALNAIALTIFSERHSYIGVPIFAVVLTALIGVRALGYKELELLRNGILLPIFPLTLLRQRPLRVVLDLGFAIASLIGARWIHDLAASQHRLWFESLPVLCVAALVQVALLAAGGLYRTSYRLANGDDGLVIFRSILYASIGTWALSLPFGTSAFPAFEMMFIDLYFLATLVAGTRVSFYLMDQIFNNARRSDRRVVIYGTGPAGTAALHALQESGSFLTVVGFLDDEESKSQFHELPVMKSGALNQTPRNFDEIVLATEKIPEKTLRALSTRCRLAKVPLKRFSVDCTDVDPASFATRARDQQDARGAKIAVSTSVNG